MPMGRKRAISKQALPSEKVKPLVEAGSIGFKHSGGFILDEFQTKLQGQRAAKVYREMQDNSSILSASLYLIEQFLRQVKFKIEPRGKSETGKAQADFVRECLDDMSYSWADTLGFILTMLPFGYAPCELIYKKRLGPEKDPASRFSDGKIGWRKIALRMQETIERWDLDENGGIKGLWQNAPHLYLEVYIPIEKMLLFRTSPRVPTGRSLLRGAYFDWQIFKRLTEIAAIGAERDLAGMPIGRIPSDTDATVKAEFRKILENIKNHEQAMALLSSATDESGKYLQTLELLGSPGQKQFDIQRMIERYELRMALSLLTDVLLVGHEKAGSYALSGSKVEALSLSLSGVADSICEVFTRYAIPRLLALNGESLDETPEMVHSDIAIPDLGQITALLDAMGKAGVDVFPDEDLTRQLFTLAKLTTKGRDKIERDDSGQPLPADAPAPSAINLSPAEIQSARELMASIASGETPRDSGIGQLTVLFGMTKEQAEALIGTAGSPEALAAQPKPEPPPIPGQKPPKPGEQLPEEEDEPEPKSPKGPVEKGDLPGHEFHGNQWTGGQGEGSGSENLRDVERTEAYSDWEVKRPKVPFNSLTGQKYHRADVLSELKLYSVALRSSEYSNEQKDEFDRHIKALNEELEATEKQIEILKE